MQFVGACRLLGLSNVKCAAINQNAHFVIIIIIHFVIIIIMIMFSSIKLNTKTWAVSEHTDTSKNTKATLKCYALHTCVGPIFSNDIKCDTIHPPEREINPLKAVCGCPWGAVIKNGQTCSVFVCVVYV